MGVNNPEFFVFRIIKNITPEIVFFWKIVLKNMFLFYFLLIFFIYLFIYLLLISCLFVVYIYNDAEPE